MGVDNGRIFMFSEDLGRIAYYNWNLVLAYCFGQRYFKEREYFMPKECLAIALRDNFLYYLTDGNMFILDSEDGILLKSIVMSGEDFRLDKDGNIFLSLTNEGQIIKFDIDGKILERINLFCRIDDFDFLNDSIIIPIYSK